MLSECTQAIAFAEVYGKVMQPHTCGSLAYAGMLMPSVIQKLLLLATHEPGNMTPALRR